LLLALLAASARTAAAQGRLVAAELNAAFDSTEQVVTVHIHYTLQPHGEGEVPLAVVRFGDAALENVRVNNLPTALTFDASGLRATATVAGPSGDTAVMDVAYDVRVSATEPSRIRIPVVAVLWPTEQAVAGAFVANVTLPAGTVAFDAFPSTLRRLHAADATANTYATELHVLPALITFSLAAHAPWPSAITGIELLVCAGLVLMGIIGWRRFRVEMR
jgi:hypothetical protein